MEGSQQGCTSPVAAFSPRCFVTSNLQENCISVSTVVLWVIRGSAVIFCLSSTTDITPTNWFHFTWSHVSCHTCVGSCTFIHTHVSILVLLLFFIVSVLILVRQSINTLCRIGWTPSTTSLNSLFSLAADFCIWLIKVVLSFLIFIPHILNNTWILVHWIKN